MKETQKLYNTALRILGRREHSERELSVKLKAKHSFADTDQVANVLQRLKDDNYQSDERYTQSLIRSRVGRGYGPFYIRQELASKGIAKPLIEAEMSVAEVDWLATAFGQVQRRYSAMRGHDEHFQRASRFLQRRGFPGDIVSKALHKVLDSQRDSQGLE